MCKQCPVCGTMLVPEEEDHISFQCCVKFRFHCSGCGTHMELIIPRMVVDQEDGS